jgi:hypothetical protein
MSLVKKIYKTISPKYQKLFLEYLVEFKPRESWSDIPHKKLLPLLNKNRELYKELLTKILSKKEFFFEIPFKTKEAKGMEPYWDNGFFPGLDIVALYTILDIYKPETYLEVGSGNSTKVVRKSISDHRLKTKIVSVDPYPRADIDSISDVVVRNPLENLADYKIFENLKANDILFIDNSHRSFPNSDVTVFFLEILPMLNPGVIVQVHDIYLPYDYPQFMAERYYNEQYLLACYLLGGIKTEIIFPGFFISRDEELASIIEDIWTHKNTLQAERHGGSFWFKTL